MHVRCWCSAADAAADDDDDDVQWFNVHLKADYRSQRSLAHKAKVETDMPENNDKQLESVESVRWVER